MSGLLDGISRLCQNLGKTVRLVLVQKKDKICQKTSNNIIRSRPIIEHFFENIE